MLHRVVLGETESRLEAVSCYRDNMSAPRPPEKDFGGFGRAPGQFEMAYDVASLPEGAVCVADAANHRLQIFSKEQGAAPRVITM